MKSIPLVPRLAAIFLLALLPLFPVRGQTGKAGDPLPSWNDGDARTALITFVTQVTTSGLPTYIPPVDRIATFDNDGTLWSEQPLYFQFLFMLERVKDVAPQHPEWKDNPAFQALEANDLKALAALGEKPVLQLLAGANTGMTTDEYDAITRAWLANARHPKFNRPYTELVFQPMLELLTYLRSNGFKTFIVSGGSVEFMRPWVGKVYGIPPEQVVGSLPDLKYELRDGQPVLVRQPNFFSFVDDGPGKPLGIYRAIGRKPIAAFGNSDGDLQMLQYATSGPGPRLALIVHHDDAAREFAYDRESSIGKLDKALDEAAAKKWVVVSMKQDWKTIYPAPAVPAAPAAPAAGK